MAICLTELLMFSGFMLAAYSIVARDAGKAMIGLVVSIGLALGLPVLERNLSGKPAAAATKMSAEVPDNPLAKVGC